MSADSHSCRWDSGWAGGVTPEADRPETSPGLSGCKQNHRGHLQGQTFLGRVQAEHQILGPLTSAKISGLNSGWAQDIAFTLGCP